MKAISIFQKVFSRPALVGAALAVFCGLLLWSNLVGDAWENASYDSLYRFGHRAVTDQVVLIRMDNRSYAELKQARTNYWDRSLHTQLLSKLTADGARQVVFDIRFENTNDPVTDAKFADAMRRNGHVVLDADVEDENLTRLDAAGVKPPAPIFQEAAAGWGIGQSAALVGQTARRHWPFWQPGEKDFRSLGWAAALAYGAQWNTNVENQWLRYYGANGPGETVPYWEAGAKPKGYFHGKIVFIGNWPEQPGDPGANEIQGDKFCTPYTSQTGRAVGGMEIMATTFLNLIHGEWLHRPPAWVECALLVLTGILIGGGLCQLKPWFALPVAAGIFLAVMLAFVSWSYFTNWWFPWLVIAGGQVPCAAAVSCVAWLVAKRDRESARYPGFEAVGKPFDAGSFGQVLLVCDEAGHLRALKEVNLKQQNGNRENYEREFHGLKTYLPVSDKHFELLQVKFVRRFDDQGYFFYIMELSDPLDPAWDRRSPFKAFSLHNYCEKSGGRLAVSECVRIGVALAEALRILHDEANLVHRDIKPANVVFVNGRPKLADVGLVREALRAGENPTRVFTPGFADPLGLGTKLADIYALAITLYVISTGQEAKLFPNLPTLLAEQTEFMRLNEIICKCCRSVATERYPGAAALLADLRVAQNELNGGDTKKI